MDCRDGILPGVDPLDYSSDDSDGYYGDDVGGYLGVDEDGWGDC